MRKSYIKNQDQGFLGYYESDEFRVAVVVPLPDLLYVTAERGHPAEATGHLVLSGSVLRLHKQSSMTVMEAQESPLFNNIKLQRKLPVESIQIVLEELRKKGNLEWLDKNKSSFPITQRRPEEWGKLIYQWVSRSGQSNSVFTLYDLTGGEDTEDEAFHGLDEATLLCAPQALQQEHKAEIITVRDGPRSQVLLAETCLLYFLPPTFPGLLKGDRPSVPTDWICYSTGLKGLKS